MRMRRFLRILYDGDVHNAYRKEGIRDLEHPCEGYREGKPAGQCYSDRHYLCRFCADYKPKSNPHVEPVGVEGERDPLAPCDMFTVGKPGGECSTDGHYLCEECVHMKPNAWEGRFE
jgi:hypothetical protein